MRRIFSLTSLLVIASLLLASCGVIELKNRSDMPLRGNRLVGYEITEPPAQDGVRNVKNVATLTGLGDDGVYAPYPLVETKFTDQSGVKRQEVRVGGDQVLGMTKPQRGMGWSRFAKVEPASICAHDALGYASCGVKVRLQFLRNVVQQVNDRDEWDFDSVWYYTVPADWLGGDNYRQHLDQAQLLSISVMQVTQLRLAWGESLFFNMNEGAVIIGGIPTLMQWGWWRETEDVAGPVNDIMDATHLLSDMVNDLETSPDRWLEFTPGGKFTDSWIKFSVGDADTYLTADRLFLNRQKEYALAYRLDRGSPWQFVRVVPRYNFEFNDLDQFVPSNIAGQLLDQNGKIKGELGITEQTNLKELERVGCQNCPNPSLEQILFYDAVTDKLLYSVTFRAYHGANDTLAIFGPQEMPGWQNVIDSANPNVPADLKRTLKTDENGKPLPDDQQTFANDEQFRNFVAEATVWNWLAKNNPMRADLFIQFRVNDQTEWAPIPCSDGGTCGFKATRFNLTSAYYFDGSTHKPWLLMQLLGESGVRTLGMSYVSGRFEGWGGIFAMAQDEFLSQYTEGFRSPETIFMFDARALTTPATLDEAWAALYNGQ